MRREMDEILQSQEKMLEKNQVSEREKFRTIYDFHLKKTYRFFKENEISYLDVNYNELVKNPDSEIQKIIEFLKLTTAIEDLIQVVKPDLYRNRNEK
jgi:hypothetical protein